ncbi:MULTISPECIES: protein kinase domain-containing protein [Staphylococcus]|uniref:protein kinase domain-containing protein n=1 Tax=Staphylococcus TaxID=1279 RepID=UPI0025553A07|nr:protein kinase [Staphylococcus equorum]MDK9868932.1 protein kinase [Staphylococcus equorum]
MESNIKIIEGEIIDQGGFSTIYECELERNGELYTNLVMKKLNNTHKKIIPHRFDREIRYMTQLVHKNIVKPIYIDYNEDIIVMPKFKYNLVTFIENNSIDNINKQELILKILDAIEYYLSEGILHRDLKPQNILIDEKNEPYLTDFGLSSKLEGVKTQLSLTKTGTSNWGTPFYISPEQYEDLKSADEKSEIYSIGRVIYSIFTEDFRAFDMAHLDKLDSKLKYIIEKSTKPNREDRFGNVNELKKAINNTFNTEISIDEMEIDDILEILEGNSSTHSKDEIFTIINNTDFVQIANFFTSLDNNKHKKLKDINKSEYNMFIDNVAENIKNSSFIFSYVDTISAKYLNLLESSIIEIKQQINLLLSFINVSTSHNRFDAMQKCGEYINSITDKFILEELKNAIIKENKVFECKKINKYYNISNLLDLINSSKGVHD